MFHKVNAIVVFVQDLTGCTKFYQDIMGLPVTFSDANSIGFRFGDQDFLLLEFASAVAMISEEAVSRQNGNRVLLCAGAEDVDAVYNALTEKGIAFIKPPIDQNWGRRTAYFADPEGNLWEIFQELPEA